LLEHRNFGESLFDDPMMNDTMIKLVCYNYNHKSRPSL